MFLHGSAVLKIVPVGGSKQMTLDEILVEMAISRELGNIQANFVKVRIQCDILYSRLTLMFIEIQQTSLLRFCYS